MRYNAPSQKQTPALVNKLKNFMRETVVKKTCTQLQDKWNGENRVDPFQKIRFFHLFSFPDARERSAEPDLRAVNGTFFI